MKIEEIERFDQQRDSRLLLQVVGFALWWGAFLLLLDLGWHPGGFGRPLLIVLGLVGWFAWLGGLVWLIRWGWALRAKPELLQALNDEGIVRSRMRALRVSFWCIVVCLVIGRIITAFVSLPTGIVLDLLIWVSVVSQVGAYLSR